MHGSISYEFLLICGMILLSALPFPLYWISRSSKRKKRTNPSQ
jgi:hypothetical protein